ncbi:hypothetical protein P4O66_013661 [Electrophorus voltai]|uniref:Chemokine interleukin-8-like domain-containing protein n=1 Tax=Electrophorus voltai TaxID=2609070 RepID=A0AAD8Z308_9TELE|nr:hypothetical protein P4O66_013661 [Electrophorus voltai]
MRNLNASSLTMKPTITPFSALLAIGFCTYFTAHVGESQHVPTRCICPRSRNRAQGPISDFSVRLQGSGCGKVEIIVILQKDKQPVCLSPHGRQGNRLLKCWFKKQEEGKDGKTCIRRLKKKAWKRRPQQT